MRRDSLRLSQQSCQQRQTHSEPKSRRPSTVAALRPQGSRPLGGLRAVRVRQAASRACGRRFSVRSGCASADDDRKTVQRPETTEQYLNPYIALADVCITLILILTFCMAASNLVGRAGWEHVRYRDMQADFANSLAVAVPRELRPQEIDWRNDPPGAQRWVFVGASLFREGSDQLTEGGYQRLEEFAFVLNEHRDKWRRIRVEGHTLPPRPGEPDNWALSAARAAAVAQVLHARGHIESYYLAIAGRAGQAPLYEQADQVHLNERVEIVLEYAPSAAAVD